ncbi:MAG: M2 family metallopeptidase [Bryobacterales bacterium]|nr:M2 family metallopeptidase [Bryobacterales bacterium]
MTRSSLSLLAAAAVLAGAVGCTSRPTAEDARIFIEQAEARLFELSKEAGQAGWVQATYITGDTEQLAARANQRLIDTVVQLVKDSRRFDGVQLPAELERKMRLLKLSLTMATPADPKESGELTRLATSMEAAYGKGRACPAGEKDLSKCLDINQVTKVMAESRNPAQLLDVWRGWHAVGAPLRKDYQRFVELSNEGSREIGYADTGAMWRSKYDMPPDEFAKEVDRLWEEVRPLYVSLHAYVRTRLRARYGEGAVPASGPIPAHLLGNMWAQSWENVYPLVAPRNAAPDFNLDAVIRTRRIDPREMTRYGERFFTSLGFEPLPQTFWERSLFTKPRDREVVCHASAWDVDNVDDLRIKMCIEPTSEDFITIHHELGHNFYQRAYNQQPMLFRDSANDGFHEALGDTIALSMTPEYFVKLGFLAAPTDSSKDIGLLLSRALEKVAFLPFGILIDQWRWKVFSGEITPEHYNQAWWELRRKYQGVAEPVSRSESDFDPGAKYHVPANVPYTRYFLAHVLQFQFHRALAQAAGCKEPLHRCSIYGNKEAGDRLKAMMAMGMSRPWPEALKALTGQERIDATAIRDYFAPLQAWLDEQNKGKPVGW